MFGEMSANRVYIVARELGVETSAVLTAAKLLGYKMANALSTLNAVQQKAIAVELRKPGFLPPDECGVASKLRPRGPGPGTASCRLKPPEEPK
jgi:Translation initiation factor IF-2, N-terminal region